MDAWMEVVLAPETVAYAAVAFASSLSSGLIGIGGATVFQALWYLLSVSFPDVQFGSIAVAAGYFSVQALVTQPLMLFGFGIIQHVSWPLFTAIAPPLLLLIPIVMTSVLLEAPMRTLYVLFGAFLFAFALFAFTKEVWRAAQPAEVALYDQLGASVESQSIDAHGCVSENSPVTTLQLNVSDECVEDAAQARGAMVQLEDDTSSSVPSPSNDQVQPQMSARRGCCATREIVLAFVAGVGGGITGGMFGAPGPPIMMFFSISELTPAAVRATCQCVLFGTSIENVTILLFHDQIKLVHWPRYVLNVACGVSGMAVGNALHKHINKAIAKRLMNGVLCTAGLLMLGEQDSTRIVCVMFIGLLVVTLVFLLSKCYRIASNNGTDELANRL